MIEIASRICNNINNNDYKRRLESLIDNYRIKIPREAYEEIDRIKSKERDFWRRYKTKAKHYFIQNEREQYIKIVKWVVKEFPKLIDINKPNSNECADPYVIALAIYFKENSLCKDVIVVTEERRDRSNKISILTTCKMLGIKCINSGQFLQELNTI